jgi:hypothetical protein
MRTSIRIIANVWRRTARNAPRPESASTSVWPRGASIVRVANRLAALSSTIKIAGAGGAAIVSSVLLGAIGAGG